LKKFFKIVFLSLILVVISAAAFLYYIFMSPNISLRKKEQPYVFIATGSAYEKAIASADTTIEIKSRFTFELASKLLNYRQRVHAGRYKVYTGMSNLALIKLLRSGIQSPVNLVFNTIRTKEQFAERIGQQLETSTDSLMMLLNDNKFLTGFGLNTISSLTLFIPNTYELFWNTSAIRFFERMKNEHEKFWSEERMQKASAIGLSPTEISVLASIIEQETQQTDEKPLLAGVYLNRLKKNMKLEADPTLVFALGDFSIKRVLSEYKEIDSPYNTYKNYGLPPGPICIPSIASIDAVLDRVSHRYLYFCAKDDFSGYHVFASTYEQHQINARRFHSVLNRRGIRK